MVRCSQGPEARYSTRVPTLGVTGVSKSESQGQLLRVGTDEVVASCCGTAWESPGCLFSLRSPGGTSQSPALGTFPPGRERGEEEEEAGVEDGDGRARLRSLLAARLNRGRGRAASCCLLRLPSCGCPACKAERGRAFALRWALSEGLSQVRHPVTSCCHIFPVVICVCPFPFRSKAPGQARGARSLPIPTAIKASSPTAARCCAGPSTPGRSPPPPRRWESRPARRGGPRKGRICRDSGGAIGTNTSAPTMRGKRFPRPRGERLE